MGDVGDVNNPIRLLDDLVDNSCGFCGGPLFGCFTHHPQCTPCEHCGTEVEKFVSIRHIYNLPVKDTIQILDTDGIYRTEYVTTSYNSHTIPYLCPCLQTMTDDDYYTLVHLSFEERLQTIYSCSDTQYMEFIDFVSHAHHVLNIKESLSEIEQIRTDYCDGHSEDDEDRQRWELLVNTLENRQALAIKGAGDDE